MSIYSWSYSSRCLYTVGQHHSPSSLNDPCYFSRFLNGRCKNSSCPYSHELTPGKVPTCSYFLKGACGQDNCPYAHSYVGHDAQLCEDFLQGFCAKGIEVCLKKKIFFSVWISFENSSVFETTCSPMFTIRIIRSLSTW